jgi:hypothetical protein
MNRRKYLGTVGSTLLSTSSLGAFDAEGDPTEKSLRLPESSSDLAAQLPDAYEQSMRQSRQRTVGPVGKEERVLFETTSRTFALPDTQTRESHLLVETGTPIAVERDEEWIAITDEDRHRTLRETMIDDHANGMAHEVILSLADGDRTVSTVNSYQRSVVRYWEHFLMREVPDELADQLVGPETEELLGERVSALQLIPNGFVAIEHSKTPVSERGATTRRTERVLEYLLNEATAGETQCPQQGSDEQHVLNAGKNE